MIAFHAFSIIIGYLNEAVQSTILTLLFHLHKPNLAIVLRGIILITLDPP